MASEGQAQGFAQFSLRCIEIVEEPETQLLLNVKLAYAMAGEVQRNLGRDWADGEDDCRDSEKAGGEQAVTNGQALMAGSAQLL